MATRAGHEGASAGTGGERVTAAVPRHRPFGGQRLRSSRSARRAGHSVNLPQDTSSTTIKATISVLPNLFTVVTVPERRIFARFTGAMREEDALPLNRPAPTPVATDQTSPK